MTAGTTADRAAPPVAKRVPVEDVRHGDRRVDDYHWLRDPGYPQVEDPEIIAYLEAENAYREQVMAPVRPLQDELFEELKGRLKEDDAGVPVKKGDWYATWRFQPDHQYPVHYLIPAADGPDAEGRVLLDENALAEGHDYLSVRMVEPCPGYRRFAYSVDVDGSEKFEIKVRPIDGGEDLPDRVPNTNGTFAWASDGESFLYLRLDDSLRPSSVWRHRLGTPAEDDALVYEEADPGFMVSLDVPLDETLIFIEAGDHETSEVRFVPADTPDAAPTLIAPRRKGQQYSADHRDGTLYILTDDRHENRRLVTAPVATPGTEHWQEMIAPSDAVYLSGHLVFRDFLVVVEREAGVQHVRVRRFADGESHRIEFDEPAYSVHPRGNAEAGQTHLRLGYQSLVTPPTVLDYDMESRERTVRKVQEIPSGYDASAYVSEREWATAPDGEKVPVTIVRRRDTPKDGSAPLYLYAYGSYGATIDPYFSPNRLSLLDRGWVWALAHPRGGSDLGRRWYLQGKLEHKVNTFTDVIAVGRHLAAQGYTAEGRLTVAGGSAGGLMVGACINMAPDLFHAAAAHVPFVDVLNTMLDDTLWLTPSEFVEWGNPIADADAYFRIKGYSPYDNVEAKRYPHLFVTGGISDPRVTYWEPAKWVAKLRATKTDDNLLVLRMNMGAGHGGASGRYESLKELAEEYAFLLLVYGMAEGG